MADLEEQNSDILGTGQRPPRSRRWFRFSLRTLLVLFTLVSVALGMYVKRERDRYLAIETIKRWGGQVRFSDPAISAIEVAERWTLTTLALQEGKPRPEFPEDVPRGKNWLRGMFGQYGKYHGGRVESVYLTENAFTPPGVVYDVGVLSAIPEVKTLILSRVNPAALASLPRMPRLELLVIESGTINDNALDCVNGSTRLQRLDLPGARLTSSGMAKIGLRTKLTSLALNRSTLDDAGFAHLIRLPLRDLSLNQSNTSDAALPFLAQMKGLSMLYIEYTNITEEGVERLNQELPGCRIAHDYPWLE